MPKAPSTCYYRLKGNECLRVTIYRGRVMSFEIIPCPEWFISAVPPKRKPSVIPESIERDYRKATRDFLEAIKSGNVDRAMSLWNLYKEALLCYIEEV
jgi:hypothetical protein